MRWLAAVLAFTLVISTVGIAEGPRLALASDMLAPDLVAILADDSMRAWAVDDDIQFRTAFHFEADREYVESLYVHPERTVGTRVAGALLTPDEFAEVQIRDQLENDAHIVKEWYDHHPAAAEDFGGVRIDHAAGGVLAVYLKAGAAGNWFDKVQRPGRVRIRSTDISRHDLQALQTAIDAAWVAGDPATEGITRTSIAAEGEVVVAFRPAVLAAVESGTLPTAFKARFGAKHIRAVAAAPAEAVDYVRGGYSWRLTDGGDKWCSLGFKMDMEGNANEYMTSAGHCANDGPNDWRTSKIGPIAAYRWGEGYNADIAIIRVDEPYEAAAVVIHDVGAPYVLDVVDSVNDHPEGARRCQSGMASGFTRCGVIAVGGDDVTGYYDDTNSGPYHVYHMAITDRYPEHGDSGGPVYWNNLDTNVVKAAGSISARHSGQTLYTKIGWMQLWNTELVTRTSDGCDLPPDGGSDDCTTAGGGDY